MLFNLLFRLFQILSVFYFIICALLTILGISFTASYTGFTLSPPNCSNPVRQISSAFYYLISNVSFASIRLLSKSHFITKVISTSFSVMKLSNSVELQKKFIIFQQEAAQLSSWSSLKDKACKSSLLQFTNFPSITSN